MLRREFLQLGAAVPLVPHCDRAVVSCILLNLTGGPAHLDTWDMKPEAPSEIRGPFRPIRTNVAGIEISEIFPRMARHADKFSLIRSVYHEGPALHETGLQLTQTGRMAHDQEYPHVGSVVARCTGSQHATLNGPLSRFGQNCIRARRLVESGVRFVTVNMSESVYDQVTWDSHGSRPFSTVADYRNTTGPIFDSGYSALIEDLHQRGILGTTLVVGMGEFGRSPGINPAGGRDHWPQCWTVHMAGGGVKGGQVYGSSDRNGAEPRDHPVHASRLVATIYHALGVPCDLQAPPVRELFA